MVKPTICILSRKKAHFSLCAKMWQDIFSCLWCPCRLFLIAAFWQQHFLFFFLCSFQNKNRSCWNFSFKLVWVAFPQWFCPLCSATAFLSCQLQKLENCCSFRFCCMFVCVSWCILYIFFYPWPYCLFFGTWTFNGRVFGALECGLLSRKFIHVIVLF